MSEHTAWCQHFDGDCTPGDCDCACHQAPGRVSSDARCVVPGCQNLSGAFDFTCADHSERESEFVVLALAESQYRALEARDV